MMMPGSGPIGSAPPLDSVGTAAGLSKALGKGGVVAITLQVGSRAIRAGPAVGVELDESRLPNPPAAAERLLRWLLPLQLQEPILGDLAEMYANT